MCGITNGVVFLTVLGYRHYNRRSRAAAGENVALMVHEKLAKKPILDDFLSLIAW